MTGEIRERRHAEGLEVVEVVLDPHPVPALVPAERAGLDGVVVVDVAVGEAIGDDLVDDLVAPILHVGREDGLLGGRGERDARRLGGHREEDDDRREEERRTRKT